MSKISISIAAFFVALGTGFILGGMMSSNVIKVSGSYVTKLFVTQ